jgi:hypothetical protein
VLRDLLSSLLCSGSVFCLTRSLCLAILCFFYTVVVTVFFSPQTAFLYSRSESCRIQTERSIISLQGSWEPRVSSPILLGGLRLCSFALGYTLLDTLLWIRVRIDWSFCHLLEHGFSGFRAGLRIYTAIVEHRKHRTRSRHKATMSQSPLPSTLLVSLALPPPSYFH